MRSTYHHGNLYEALLNKARNQLERDGYESLSLRALATELGVARSAPYRHFQSREHLLAVLVWEGSVDLQARYQAAADLPASPVQRVEAACRGYLDFARERRELFRLMYVTNISWTEKLQIYMGRSLAAYPIFERLVAATLPGADELTVNAASIACWSAIHGMALLGAGGHLQRRYRSGQTDDAVLLAMLGRLDITLVNI